MERDSLIISMISMSMLLALVGALLFITEYHELSEEQLLAGYAEEEVPSTLEVSFAEVAGGTTVVYVHSTTIPLTETEEIPLEETETEETFEEADDVIKELVQEKTEIEVVLDDLESAFNQLDNLDDDLQDFKDSIADADDDDDLEDLEEDLEDIEDEIDDLEDFIDAFEEQFNDLNYSDFEGYDEDDFDGIEESIDNAQDDHNDLLKYYNEVSAYLSDRYDDV